ncbi:ribonuclease H-like domain-containing protein, partial [Tanacetum coccineum]
MLVVDKSLFHPECACYSFTAETVGNKRILNCTTVGIKLQRAESVSAQVAAAAKLPVLNPNEFELWKMRIKQYFLMTDYALWEVILNSDLPLPTRTIDGVESVVPPTTVEQKLARKNELKARGTLLMALPNEHQLKFNTYKDAKTLMEAIKKRFGGLDQIYDRLQKLISQLEIHGETISQEDVNLKLFRSLPSEWKTHTLIWRNKPNLEDLSMDDLYNNLKIYEAKVMGSSSTCQNTQNVAFVSSNSTGSTKEAVKTAHGVSAANSKANASTLPNVDSLSDAEFRQEDMKGILGVRWTDTISFDKTKVECYNCHRRGHFARECRAPRNQDSKNREPTRRTMLVKETTSKALVSQCFSSSSSSDTEVNDRYKIGKGYHVVPPPYNGNFMPPKPDLVLVDKDEYVFNWISDSENENKIEFKSRQRKPSNAKVKFVKSNEHVKSPRESVKKKMVEKPIWNNARRVNHQNTQRLTHPHPKRNFVPRVVLMKSGLKTLNTARQNSLRAAISVYTARPINTAYLTPIVNCARPASNVFNKAHSHVRRPFNNFTSNKNSNLNEIVNTVKGNVTTAGPKAVV